MPQPSIFRLFNILYLEKQTGISEGGHDDAYRESTDFYSVSDHRQTEHTSAPTNSYLQPVSLSLLIVLDRRRTQPKKPAPCFLWIFLWFQTLIVMESAFPMYLKERYQKKTFIRRRKGIDIVW